MGIVQEAVSIFNASIVQYHVLDDPGQPWVNPYEKSTFQGILFEKNWIDTVQWHFEDQIRYPRIDPVEALQLKRKIDAYNQLRTDLVEQLDLWFFHQYKEVIPDRDAVLNTETPAWAFDRLSILCLKIYHMQAEVNRKDADAIHKSNCRNRLVILEKQKDDLVIAIEQLLADIKNGKRKISTYKQMKMYNDPHLNPVLYKK